MHSHNFWTVRRTRHRRPDLFHHLGDVQRALAAEGFVLPPRSLLLSWLHAAGYSAVPSHMEGKGLKTSATLAELVAVVAARRDRGDLSVVLDLD